MYIQPIDNVVGGVRYSEQMASEFSIFRLTPYDKALLAKLQERLTPEMVAGGATKVSAATVVRKAIRDLAKAKGVA